MFKNYVKLAVKVLLRRKMFTFINLFGISFTLTILLAATTIYTLMVISNPVEKHLSKSLFLKYVEFSDESKGSISKGPAMPYLIESCIRPLKKDVKLISVYGSQPSKISAYLNNERVDIDIRSTDENFWKIFSFNFIGGRPFGSTEIQNNIPCVVICESVKETFFGQNEAIGKQIVLNEKTYKVIGEVKDIPRIYLSAYAQVWIPYNYTSYVNEVKDKKYLSWQFEVAIEANSQNDFTVLQQKVDKELKKLVPPEHFKTIHAKLLTPFEIISQDENQFRIKAIILGIVFLFCLIPLMNLTNLTVSRIFERSSEIGVRKAFGATGKVLIRQFVYENVLVTILGGIIGFAGSWLLLKGLNNLNIMPLGSLDINFRILVYGFLIILVFGILSGFYPSLKMSKLNIIDCLKGGKQ